MSDENGQAAELLEELRVSLFERGQGGLLAGDPRAQLIFERLAERMHEPDETDPLEVQRCARSKGALACLRLWNEYVERSLASIERRSTLLTEHGRPRVTCEYHAGGSVRHLDLADWRGQRRARAVYNRAGEPVEIRLTALSGEEVTYTQETFGVGAGASFAVAAAELVERARRSCAMLAQEEAQPKEELLAKKRLEAACNTIFPRVEELLQRELDEGRQLVSTSEDLIEMSFQQLLEHLAQTT
mmetsp:Transcript_91766/g.213406  ORF Transcript_91766/g.213406 Transcript_91766/m.213406 type:complete len:244 (-) Transcript_91766:241-972(-)